MNLEPAVGVGSKNPLFGYDLVPLASYVVNFKSLGPKLWKFFPDIDQIGPVKYKSIDAVTFSRVIGRLWLWLLGNLNLLKLFFTVYVWNLKNPMVASGKKG